MRIGYRTLDRGVTPDPADREPYLQAGCEILVVDVVSPDGPPPAPARLLDFVHPGETLVVESLAALAASAEDVGAILEHLRSARIDLCELRPHPPGEEVETS